LGLGLELETEQASQPLALFCSPKLVRKDKEWTNGIAKLAITLSQIVRNDY